MGQLEKFVEKTIKANNARFEKSESLISEISHKVERASSAIQSVTIKLITADLPEMLSKMELDVDNKVEQKANQIKQEFNNRLSKLLTLNEVKNMCDSSVAQCINEGKLATTAKINEIINRIGALHIGTSPAFENKIKHLEKEIIDLKEMNKKLETKLQENSPTGPLSDEDKRVWENFKHKTEIALDDLPALKGDLSESLKNSAILRCLK